MGEKDKYIKKESNIIFIVNYKDRINWEKKNKIKIEKLNDKDYNLFLKEVENKKKIIFNI